MTTDPDRLDPGVRAALLAGELAGGPSDDQRRRMATRLAAALGMAAADFLPDGGGGGGGGEGGGGGGADAGAVATTAVGTKTAIIAGVALVGGGAIGVTVSELRHRDDDRATVVIAAPADAAPVAPPDAPLPDAGAVADASLATTPRPRRDAAVAAASPDASTAAATLGHERRLLDVARAAIRKGEHRLALQNLAEHELRYRDGTLLEEREVLYIELEVARGDTAAAARRARAFRAAHPTSIFTQRVDELVPP